MKTSINERDRKEFFTVYDVNLMDDVRVEKMKSFLKGKGWMQWGDYFWAKYEDTIVHLPYDPNYPGMLLEDAYNYELNKLNASNS